MLTYNLTFILNEMFENTIETFWLGSNLIASYILQPAHYEHSVCLIDLTVNRSRFDLFYERKRFCTF